MNYSKYFIDDNAVDFNYKLEDHGGLSAEDLNTAHQSPQCFAIGLSWLKKNTPDFEQKAPSLWKNASLQTGQMLSSADVHPDSKTLINILQDDDAPLFGAVLQLTLNPKETSSINSYFAVTGESQCNAMWTSHNELGGFDELHEIFPEKKHFYEPKFVR